MIQSFWRKELAIQRTEFLHEAMLKRQNACRKLVLKWHGRVLRRFRGRLQGAEVLSNCMAGHDTILLNKERDSTCFREKCELIAGNSKNLNEENPVVLSRESELTAAIAALRRLNGTYEYEQVCLERQCAEIRTSLVLELQAASLFQRITRRLKSSGISPGEAALSHRRLPNPLTIGLISAGLMCVAWCATTSFRSRCLRSLKY